VDEALWHYGALFALLALILGLVLTAIEIG
jgi:hypothetical protein